jgi:hypothetical protein
MAGSLLRMECASFDGLDAMYSFFHVEVTENGIKIGGTGPK